MPFSISFTSALNMYRCDDFITLCEVHREFYLSSPDIDPKEKCCNAIFNPVPFFSHTGTCFTTHAEIIETLPFTFSSIKVWLNMRSDNSPGKELKYKFFLYNWNLSFSSIFIYSGSHLIWSLMMLPFGKEFIYSPPLNGIRDNVINKKILSVFGQFYQVPFTKVGLISQKREFG